MAKSKGNGNKVVSDNRRARHDYSILESFEAGVVLKGTEVKSLRQGTTSLQESYITIKNGEMFILGWHIPPYEHGNIFNVDPTRTRKLLMHKRQIENLDAKVAQDGLTLIPLRLYFKEGKLKLELGLARGKKLYDKREDIKKRDISREIQQQMKNASRY